MKIIWAGHITKNQNPKDLIWFSFKRLEKFVSSSLPETERLRENECVFKMLKEAGDWKERVSSAQGKSRHLTKYDCLHRKN